jgi:hypothetical protein
MKKALKIFSFSLWSLFAIIGIFLMAGFFAMKMGFTNVPGAIAFGSQYLSQTNTANAQSAASAISSTTHLNHVTASSSVATSTTHNFTKEKESAAFYCTLSVLFESYPADALNISKTYNQINSFATANKQIALVSSYADSKTQERIKTCQNKKDSLSLSLKRINGDNTFQSIGWMRSGEWKTFASGIVKEKNTIDRVAQETGVPARMIVAMTVSEQMRLYDSNRQAFKNYFAPLGILGTETAFSLGVTGIKEKTADKIENNLMDKTSAFYLGGKYQNLITYTGTTTNKSTVRIERLTNKKNHYYSYLYAALYVKEIEAQWKNAGYDLSSHPGILATLWNIGFYRSKPNANPQFGGAAITSGTKKYTFGSLAYEFYYSGALEDTFPYPASK